MIGIVNAILLSIIVLIVLYPIYFTIIASLSDPYTVVKGKVFLWPKGFTLDAYKYVFEDERIWRGYRNTILYTIFGTSFNLFLTIPAAYVLSKKKMAGHGLFTILFLIPMYFSGGLIPMYLQVKNLQLIDKPWTLVILGGLSIYNMVVARTYYQSSIPGEIYESATIDGANDFRQFFSLAIPLSAPILAVMALYYAVGHWNNYFNAMIYTSSSKLQPLQIELRSILLLNQTAYDSIADLGLEEEEVEILARRAYVAEAMKYSLIFISSAPMLIAYPFLQRFFIKGMMIGSLKG